MCPCTGCSPTPAERVRLGSAAHEQIRVTFVGDWRLRRSVEIFAAVLPER